MSETRPKFDPKKVFFGITPTLWWNDDFVLDRHRHHVRAMRQRDGPGRLRRVQRRAQVPDRPGHPQGGPRPARPPRLGALGQHLFHDREDERSRRWTSFHKEMDFIKEMGATDMVVAEFGQAVNPLPAVSLFANRPIFDDRQWDELCMGLEHLGKLCERRGLRLCYHPHMGTGVMVRERRRPPDGEHRARPGPPPARYRPPRLARRQPARGDRAVWPSDQAHPPEERPPQPSWSKLHYRTFVLRRRRDGHSPCPATPRATSISARSSPPSPEPISRAGS